MNSALISCVIDAVSTAARQSETGEIHGGFDMLAAVIEHEYQWPVGRLGDALLQVALDTIFEGNSFVMFFRGMGGELNFVDRGLVITDVKEHSADVEAVVMKNLNISGVHHVE